MIRHYRSFPDGLNAHNRGNIVRTAEGQQKVSAAVSLAKRGRTKESSLGCKTQSEKLRMMTGGNRSDKQKAWDIRLSEYNKSIGKRPPSLVAGSKRMNDGQTQKWVRPDNIEQHLQDGWVFGECVKRQSMSEETKANQRKPKSEEAK